MTDIRRTRSKYFLAGVASGTAITLCAIWAVSLVRSDSTYSPDTIDSSLNATNVPDDSAPALDEELRESTLSNDEPGRTISKGNSDSIPTLPAPTVADPTRLTTTTYEVDSARRPIPISDAHAEMLGNSGGRSSMHAKIEAEPEDDNWSYFMEQSLMLFVSQHRNSEMFSIFNIECRTTLCEIQVVGYDESTSPDWQRVLFDLRQQPWYDFGSVGTSHSDFQGQLAIVTHLTRRTRESS